MPGASTTPRFCSQCGAALVPGGRFCSSCGTDLRSGTPRAGTTGGGAPSWRLTSAGLGLSGSLLVTGLAIWAAILSPEPPRAGLGGAAAGGAPRTAQAPADAPETTRPAELPNEVKTFITELAARAKAAPDDLATWNRLGAVYYRAAQLDASYYPESLRAFEHVLAKEPGNLEALKGKANVFYDRNDHAQAIPLYEKVLATQPDEPNVNTDLATMYLAAGDAKKAIDRYEAVIAKHPEFLQAHYNLAVTHAQLGHKQMAADRFRTARRLAPDDATRKQIDDMMARLGAAPDDAGGTGAAGGTGPGGVAAPAGGTVAPEGGSARTAFQQAVEKAFRGAPIMGQRIVRFDWTGPGTGRVLVQSFPMDSMPPAVRDRFADRLAQELRAATASDKPEGPVRIEIADAAAGTVMSTVTP